MTKNGVFQNQLWSLQQIFVHQTMHFQIMQVVGVTLLFIILISLNLFSNKLLNTKLELYLLLIKGILIFPIVFLLFSRWFWNILVGNCQHRLILPNV